MSKPRKDDTVYTFVMPGRGTVWLWNGTPGGRCRAAAPWVSMRPLDGTVRWVATGYRSKVRQ